MGRQIIELVEVLVDRIEKNGYQQRAREDDIADVYKRLNEAEGQAKHWRQARQDAIVAGELMKAEIATLREQLAEAQQQLAGAHAPAMAQQSEEIAYLRARLDEERSVIASLRQQLESALALLTGQRLNAEEQDREIERLRKFADGVRTQVTRYTMSWASWNEIKSALAELDGQPAPVADTAERERLANLVRFVEHVREFLSKNNSYITYADINGVRNALRSLDYQNPKVDVTAEGGT